MSRFLIEVTHEAETISCARAIQVLLKSGSHFLTHADFGCKDGDHRAWITVEADSKEEAKQMLPPAYREKAHVIMLTKFSLADVDELLKHHDEH